MTKLSEIKPFVEAHYDIVVTNSERLTDKVWKLQSANQAYLLKITDGEGAFVMKQLYAHKELKEHVLPIYKTSSGESMVRHGKQVAYLTDYIEQIPIPFEKQVHDYVSMLKKLHEETALTVEKHDEEIRLMYETHYNQLQKNFTVLEQHMQTIEMKMARSPFEWYVMMIYPLLYGMYRRSDDAMQKFYRQLHRKKSLPVAMVHGDVNMANTLSGVEASYLINFETSHFDLPTTDIIRLLMHYHQIPGVKRIIKDYLVQQEELVRYDFFINALCVDLDSLFKALSGNSLMDISLLNEKMAPGILAMEIHDELYQPKKPPKKKAKPVEEKADDDT